MPLLHFFISKHRKLDFEISILIRDLANVPLVSGLYYVKWRIKNASHASGMTERAPINDHCIFWNHPINTMAQLVINKQHVLGACELKLEIFQELSGGKETHSIGSLTINLSEYADSGVTTRRYLLDQSKFNSTIKLSVRMKPKSDVGTNFQVPQSQKSAIVEPYQQQSPQPQQQSHEQQQPHNSQLLHQQHHQQQQQRDRSPLSDDRSIESVATTSERRRFHPSVPQLKKSHSAMSLPHFCKQNTPFSNPDDPSPTDFVEQLFTRKAFNVQATTS